MALEGGIDDKGFKGKFKQTATVLRAQAGKILKEQAVLMTSYVNANHLRGGTTDTKLKVRSGQLIQGTRALPVYDSGGIIESGTGFHNTLYAGVHIGPRGRVTTIRPKTKKWLTIPLDAAMTGGMAGGQARGSALSGRFVDTFIMRSKKGNPIIYGKLASSRGKGAGKGIGKIVPLFVLVKQVKIKTRVFPEDILRWEMPRMIKAFGKIGIDLKEV